MKNQTKAWMAASILFASLGGNAFAADEISQTEFDNRFLPAVSGLNAKLALGYSHFDFSDITVPFVPFTNDSQDGLFLEGSVTVPLGERFGLQIDGVYQDAEDSNIDLSVRGIGAHLFWRDPADALLGIYAETKEYGDVLDSYVIAAEAEFYRGDFSLEAFAGIENLDTAFGDDDFFTGQVQLAYYMNENARVSIGVSQRFDVTSVVLGAEAMFDTGEYSPALFVDAAFGEDDTSSVSGGIRFYFGNESKSLIRRHREDDPVNRLRQGVDAAGTCANNAQSAPAMGMVPVGMPPVAMTTFNQTIIAAPALLPTFSDCALTGGLAVQPAVNR